MKKFVPAVLASGLILGSAVSYCAQSVGKDAKKNQRPVPATTQESIPAQPEVVQPQPVKTPTKQNRRPAADGAPNADSPAVQIDAVYFYEFSQPEFVISKILIEHDENGRGRISFMKRSFDEMITDPIQVSPAALERIRAAVDALNFVESTENYQFEKDYSHLGNVTIRIKREGREREAKFNWTNNLDARALANEYRKIANQFIWIFEINVSRENQPLDAPRLLDTLDFYVKRNEIADAAQMLPLLRELGDDERIPLIARNHAKRLTRDIEKAAARAQK